MLKRLECRVLWLTSECREFRPVLRSRTNDDGEILKNSMQSVSRAHTSLSLSLSLKLKLSLPLARAIDTLARASYHRLSIRQPLSVALIVRRYLQHMRVGPRSRKRTIGPQSKAHGNRLSMPD